MEANLPVGIRTNSFLFIRQHKTTEPISLHNLSDKYTYDI